MKSILYFACAFSFNTIINAQVSLGVASSYALLAATTITNTGPSQIFGNVGLFPGTSVTGFEPNTVSQGVINVNNPAAMNAKDAAENAFNVAGTLASVGISSVLAGQNLGPGVYNLGAALLTVGGTLTLDGHNDPNSVWVFQVASTLTTVTGSKVALINGANGFETGATNLGGLYALTAAVTLDDNIVSSPDICSLLGGGASSSSTSSSTGTGTGTGINTGTVTGTITGTVTGTVTGTGTATGTGIVPSSSITSPHKSHKHGGHHKENDYDYEDQDDDEYEKEDDYKYEKEEKYEDEDCKNDEDKGDNKDHEYSYRK
ncbi:hypothetical protein NQZ79_g6248 [Umbelopsis isabellina]|nr:hypothetical protein NQZ79_g6248 [Umbelopsis isabellina]